MNRCKVLLFIFLLWRLATSLCLVALYPESYPLYHHRWTDHEGSCTLWHVRWPVWLNINLTTDSAKTSRPDCRPTPDYRSGSKSKYHVSVWVSGMSFVKGKCACQSREWKLEQFECRRVNLNSYYMLLISYSCPLCMVAEWEITVCCSWKDFYSWKNSHNFLVTLSSRCQSLLAQAHCLKWNHRQLLSVGDSK